MGAVSSKPPVAAGAAQGPKRPHVDSDWEREQVDRRDTAWYVDRAITALVFVGGISAILFIGGIFAFILQGGLGFIIDTLNPAEFFGSTKWRPSSDNPRYGALALVVGTASVTGLAMLISVPLSLGAAEKSGRPAMRAETTISVGVTPR